VWVEHVALDNFRGFVGAHRFDLPPRLAVLVGRNGAGKSAVLDAIAGNLSGAASQVAGRNEVWMLGGDEANIAAGQRGATWACVLRDGDTTEGVRCRAGEVAGWRRPALGDFRLLSRYRDGVSDPTFVLPHLAYVHSGSTRTPVAITPEDAALGGRLEAWRGAFDSESLQFDALEEWFEREENLENQQKVERRKLTFELASLRAVRGALGLFLGVLHGTGLAGLRVVRFHHDGQLAPARGRLVIRKGEHELFLGQLSDGERRLVLLVADTARRMVSLNPGLSNPLESPGVILIDEIELHLHPQWQRRVVGALQAAFPRVQLIASTHAPAVLSTVPNECVVVLDEGTVLPGSPRVYGLDANSILANVMGTSTLPEPVQAKFDALYRLFDDDPRAAATAVDALAAEVGNDHPEVVRARGLLVFMAG
jgi:energy-coupling factor transporter ATP-binding protein EcfA2